MFRSKWSLHDNCMKTWTFATGISRKGFENELPLKNVPAVSMHMKWIIYLHLYCKVNKKHLGRKGALRAIPKLY